MGVNFGKLTNVGQLYGAKKADEVKKAPTEKTSIQPQKVSETTGLDTVSFSTDRVTAEDANALWALAGITPKEEASVQKTSASVIKAMDAGFDLDEVEELFGENVVGYLLEAHSTPVADRVSNNAVAITEFAETPEDIETAALLFRDAEYLKEQAA